LRGGAAARSLRRRAPAARGAGGHGLRIQALPARRGRHPPPVEPLTASSAAGAGRGDGGAPLAPFGTTAVKSGASSTVPAVPKITSQDHPRGRTLVSESVSRM